MGKYKDTILTISALLLIVIAVGVFAFFSADNSSLSEQNSDLAVNLNNETTSSVYTDLDGNPVDFDEYAGEPLVINVWASWCPFCVEELPDFETLAEEYQEQGVTVIAINRKESAATAQAFLASLDEELDDLVFVLDPEDRFYKSIGGFSMPETVFYNASGEAIFHKRGFMDLTEMREHLRKILPAVTNNQTSS